MQQMKVLKRQFHELSMDDPSPAAESSPMLALVQALSVHAHLHTQTQAQTHPHAHAHSPHSSPHTPSLSVFSTPPRTPLHRFAPPLSSANASANASERPRKTPRRSVTFADPLTVVSVVSIVSVCEEEVETEIDTEIDEEIHDEDCTHNDHNNNKSNNHNDDNDDFDGFVARDGEFFRPFSDFLSPSALGERESPSVSSSSGRRHVDLTKSFSVYEADAETESNDGFADDEREHVFRSARRALVFDD